MPEAKEQEMFLPEEYLSWKVKGKVNGEDREYTVKDLLAGAQKAEAGDARLRAAAETEKKLKGAQHELNAGRMLTQAVQKWESSDQAEAQGSIGLFRQALLNAGAAPTSVEEMLGTEKSSLESEGGEGDLWSGVGEDGDQRSGGQGDSAYVKKLEERLGGLEKALQGKIQQDEGAKKEVEQARRARETENLILSAIDKHDGLSKIVGKSERLREQFKMLAQAEVRRRSTSSLARGPQLLSEALDALHEDWKDKGASSPPDPDSTDPYRVGLGDTGSGVADVTHHLPPDDGKRIDLKAENAGPRVFRRLLALAKGNREGGSQQSGQ